MVTGHVTTCMNVVHKFVKNLCDLESQSLIL